MLESFQASVQPVLEDYCYKCHGDGSSKGGVALDEVDHDGKIRDHAFWLRALKNLRLNTMPPADEDQPAPAERQAIVDWIKRREFDLDPAQPDPGRGVVRRLNRAEYRNTVHDLLGVEFDTGAEFPADDAGYGFDNIGSVLTVSPTLLEKLLDAAQRVVTSAVPTQPYVVAEQKFPGREFGRPGQETKPVTAEDFGIPPDFLEFLGKGVVDAQYLSFYESGSVQRKFITATGGTFEMALDLQTAEKFGVDGERPPDQNRCRVSFKVDGTIVAEREFERMGQQSVALPFTVTLTPGAHTLEFSTDPIPSDAPRTRQLKMRFNFMVVRGPLAREHWVRPARYGEFFGPGLAADPVARRQATARWLRDFATRAFRRPVDDETVDRLVTVVESVAALRDHTYESGVAQAMVAVLASPRFVFRAESDEPLMPGLKYPLVDEYTLASRLSYFLWSSMPDAELFSLAERGQLRANLSAQYDRMVRDPKFSRFVADFTGQWLQARDTAHLVIDPLSVALRDQPDPEVDDARKVFRALIERDPITFTPAEAASFAKADGLLKQVENQPRPKLTNRLRRAMRQETELFFNHVVQEDRSVLELLDSDYTFLNEDLARHYAIPDVKGTEMRKVTLPPDSWRGGVLTQATVLTVTSNPTRTSPVKRGVFILDNILGLPAAPPPPNIPALEAVASPEALKKMTMRESIALHATNALCRSCHNRMDPLGLALDNFNALGVWRDHELGQPIDSSGRLISGERFSGIRQLKHILVTDRHQDFYHCLSEKLLTYALGRGMDYTDTTVLDHLTNRLEQTGGKMSALLRGIVESPAFQQRRRPVAELASNDSAGGRAADPLPAIPENSLNATPHHPRLP